MFEIKYSLDDFKFRIRTAVDQLLEIELEEAYQSTKLLHKLCNHSAVEIIHPVIENIGVWPVHQLACMILKTSHLSFPIKWRKNGKYLSYVIDKYCYPLFDSENIQATFYSVLMYFFSETTDTNERVL